MQNYILYCKGWSFDLITDLLSDGIEKWHFSAKGKNIILQLFFNSGMVNWDEINEELYHCKRDELYDTRALHQKVFQINKLIGFDAISAHGKLENKWLRLKEI